jgi:hypothetical protein
MVEQKLGKASFKEVTSRGQSPLFNTGSSIILKPLNSLPKKPVKDIGSITGQIRQVLQYYQVAWKQQSQQASLRHRPYQARLRA